MQSKQTETRFMNGEENTRPITNLKKISSHEKNIDVRNDRFVLHNHKRNSTYG